MEKVAASSRAQWGSKVGFVLATSGSAIGLGNIVFFSANAYRYGAGAFYVPYLTALVLAGIPLLVTELGLGTFTRRALPAALGRVGGRWGEFAGWWAVLNAGFIVAYYVTILAWVGGMLVGAAGPLWRESVPLPAFDLPAMANPQGFFFHMLSSWWVVGLVVLMWALNLWIVRHGVVTIEPMVKVFVPLMWLFMAVLIVRGVTLPRGEEGVFLLFTPDFRVMGDVEVWQGAFSQIFFTLTLGFGTMTAYASFLPRDSDTINYGLLTACLNCGFEYIAGLAIFAFLFAFAIVPQASTLAMMFFVVPQGIAAMPAGVMAFGLMFFFLLLIAGLSSSVSVVEGLNAALIDRFAWTRRRTLAVTCTGCMAGSLLFALPLVVDRQLASNGTLGLTFLDLIDHWAFSHGLLLVGLVECLILGWKLPIAELRRHIHRHSRLPLPAAFDWLVKLFLPAVLLFILGSSVWSEITGGLYGGAMTLDRFRPLPWVAFLLWLGGTTLGAAWLARGARPEEMEGDLETEDEDGT